MARRSYDVESQEQWIMDLNVRLHGLGGHGDSVCVCVRVCVCPRILSSLLIKFSFLLDRVLNLVVR